jgi:hypothetical protein
MAARLKEPNVNPLIDRLVRVSELRFPREVRLLAAARIHNFPYSSDEMNDDKRTVIDTILAEQFEEDPSLSISIEEVYAKAKDARMTTLYPFFNSVTDDEINTLIREVTDEIKKRSQKRARLS